MNKKKLIVVSEETYARLKLDKVEFEKVIGGGKWSMNDVLTEYFRILSNLGD